MRTKPIGVLTLLFCLAGAAHGLDTLWHADTGAPVSGIPIRVDFNADGHPDLLAPLAEEGVVACINGAGAIAHRFLQPNAVAGIATAGDHGPWAVQETSGHIRLFTPPALVETASAYVGGACLPGGGLVFADINQDGDQELLCARANGILTAFTARLTPLWQFDCGLPLSAPPAVAPVYNVSHAIYLRSGPVVQALSGGGRPLWRFVADKEPGAIEDAPIIAQLASETPSLLLTSGKLHAIDVLKGKQQWVAQLPGRMEGTPALFDYSQEEGRRILSVNSRGVCALYDMEGNAVNRWKLPPTECSAAPLVADLDGDGAHELLILTGSTVSIFSMEGEYRELLEMGGAARFMTLNDIVGTGFLELLVASRNGRLHAYSTNAIGGWVHPRGSDTRNGWVPPVQKLALPLPEKSSRRARVNVICPEVFDEKDPFSVIFIKPDLPGKTRFVSVLVRAGSAVLGAAYKPATDDGMAVPFVYAREQELSLDVGLHDASGSLVSSSTGILVRGGTTKLTELAPLEDFLNVLEPAARRHLAQPRTQPKPLETEAPTEGVVVELAGDRPSAGVALAQTRGTALSRGMRWGVSLNPAWSNTLPGGSPDAPIVWDAERATGPECGHSASLMRRTLAAAWFGGAEFLQKPAGGDVPARPVETLTGGDAVTRGAAYTPFALPCRSGEADPGKNLLVAHIFGAAGGRGLEQDSLTAGPYGEVFDIVPWDVPREKLENYAVLWPISVGNLEKTERNRLQDYARAGGIVVLNGALARQLPDSFTGAAFTGEALVANQIQTALGTPGAGCAPYRYLRMEAALRSQVLAWTESGDPLLLWRKAGEGMVVVAATEDFVDLSGALMYLAPSLLQILAETLVPVQPPADIQTFVTRLPDGWLIGLLNNTGIRKGPYSAARLDADGGRDVILRFTGNRVPLQFNGIGGAAFSWNNNAGGVGTRIESGGVAVIRVMLP